MTSLHASHVGFLSWPPELVSRGGPEGTEASLEGGDGFHSLALFAGVGSGAAGRELAIEKLGFGAAGGCCCLGSTGIAPKREFSDTYKLVNWVLYNR